MLSDKEKKNVLGFINQMPLGAVYLLNEFQPEEIGFIIHLMETQTSSRGWLIESNGTASDTNTITKIRKRLIPTFKNKPVKA